MGDLCETLHFIIFPAICYFSLKRDCQYWSIGVDEDEETSMLGYANEVYSLYSAMISICSPCFTRDICCS